MKDFIDNKEILDLVFSFFIAECPFKLTAFGFQASRYKGLEIRYTRGAPPKIGLKVQDLAI